MGSGRVHGRGQVSLSQSVAESSGLGQITGPARRGSGSHRPVHSGAVTTYPRTSRPPRWCTATCCRSARIGRRRFGVRRAVFGSWSRPRGRECPGAAAGGHEGRCSRARRCPLGSSRQVPAARAAGDKAETDENGGAGLVADASRASPVGVELALRADVPSAGADVDADHNGAWWRWPACDRGHDLPSMHVGCATTAHPSGAWLWPVAV